jgi:hypothetical protein
MKYIKNKKRINNQINFIKHKLMRIYTNSSEENVVMRYNSEQLDLIVNC